MSVSRIRLDFQRTGGPSRIMGLTLLGAGLVALAMFIFSYQRAAGEIAGLELRLESLEPASAVKDAESSGRSVAAARATVENLATPWGQLLDDLEAANRDLAPAVALLEVLPDVARGRIRVIAESRSLDAALGYLERLQKSASLANPLLESHEVRNESAERPVRVEIVADWRARS